LTLVKPTADWQSLRWAGGVQTVHVPLDLYYVNTMLTSPWTASQ